MKVTEAELIISAGRADQFPPGPFPEVALSGRSNVGKSSFVNKIIGRKALARTSQRPGKTQTLNFYRINERFHFVDVPGYGYAKVSKKERDAWGRLMERYFEERDQLKGVVQLVDVRHKPTEDDKMMYDFLKHFSKKVIVVATKADKIPKGKQQKQLAVIKRELDMDSEDPLVLFSAETGLGKDKAWREISEVLFK
ncbi:ribosome biogenesis GTP-binding protein YihA/YsxC [Alteribacter keqinensis]|uniref:Probable GTP-binding protein EngB n=1 Tax=Alteribacter keqinensis TaxID=2483800 RepID=A0A3M7TZB8_9BACI|nr:ribosome biogenesis GTP-binding protein YihA/YsxC [Alteribacter keqinensis]RNA70242.1 YihA family ribosome biogenesis GTP-binding protein [Alteribacter keqinensis]